MPFVPNIKRNNKHMSANLSRKIDNLSQKLAQLRAQKQQADALQRARTAAAGRKADTRRKILLGAFLIDQLGVDGAKQLKVQHMRLADWLSKPDDRELFGLPPSTSGPASAAHAPSASIGGEG